jgi:hypothetical protein
MVAPSSPASPRTTFARLAALEVALRRPVACSLAVRVRRAGTSSGAPSRITDHESSGRRGWPLAALEVVRLAGTLRPLRPGGRFRERGLPLAVLLAGLVNTAAPSEDGREGALEVALRRPVASSWCAPSRRHQLARTITNHGSRIERSARLPPRSFRGGAARRPAERLARTNSPKVARWRRTKTIRGSAFLLLRTMRRVRGARRTMHALAMIL